MGQLSNPFGSDQVDFPVNDWLEEFMANMQALMSYEQDGDSEDLVAELKAELRDREQLSMQLGRDEVDQFLGEVTGSPDSPKESGGSNARGLAMTNGGEGGRLLDSPGP